MAALGGRPTQAGSPRSFTIRRIRAQVGSRRRATSVPTKGTTDPSCRLDWKSAGGERRLNGAGHKAPSNPRRRQRQSGDVAAQAIDRAAPLTRSFPRARHDIEVAKVVAAEAQAGHHRARYRDVAAVAPVGFEHGDAAVVGIGDPDGAVGGDLEAIGHTTGSRGGKRAPVANAAILVDVVDPDQFAQRIGVVEAPAVG